MAATRGHGLVLMGDLCVRGWDLGSKLDLPSREGIARRSSAK